MEIVYSTATPSVSFSADNSPHHRRCIDGTVTGCGNCVGYCQFRDHPGYLTKDLRKQHDCIKKGAIIISRNQNLPPLLVLLPYLRQYYKN